MTTDTDSTTPEVTLAQDTAAVSLELCALAEEVQITPREQFQADVLADKLWTMAARLTRDGGADPEDVVNAARLAMEAGANEYARLAIVAALLDVAPPAPPRDTGSVRLLVDTLRTLGGRFEVA